MGTESARLDIHLLRFLQHLVTEVLAQRVRRVQVHAASQDPRQLLLHREEGESRGLSWLELDQDIDVAVRREVITQDRTEERQRRGYSVPRAGGDPETGPR